MYRKLIIRRAEARDSAAVLYAVDLRLQVLDPHADGKRLGGQGNVLVYKALKGVPRAVADRQDHGAGFPFPHPIGGHGTNAGETAILAQKAVQASFKADGTTQRENPLSYAFDGAEKQVGADVRLIEVKDFLRRAVSDKGLQNIVPVGAFGAGGQLAIGERPRAPFAELDV